MGVLLYFVIYVVIMSTYAKEKNNSVSESLQNKLYSDWIICDHNRNLNLDVNGTVVYFYDFQNNYNTSYNINETFVGLTSYTLNVTKKFIFYVMGYKANITWSSSETIRNTFQHVPNIYLMMVDYSVLKYKGGKPRHFENSIMHSYYVGKGLGRLLAQLHAVGIQSHNIHCIGSSLGAQILGYVGEIYTKETCEKIWRITGIDPAGPCYANSKEENQLRSGVAEYVEVYHCNAGVFGTSSILADIDVFLNNGRTQPNCHFGDHESAQCSHQRCSTYWTRTVKQSEWLALACDSYENFVAGKCVGNQVAIVGYSNPGNVTGIFYVTTDTYSPTRIYN